MAQRLDRASAVPLYFQLQEVLKGDLELGTWLPGQDLPTETELCDAYDVSRTVVRQALGVLEQDGQILRSQGRRSTVLPPKLESRAGGVSRLLAAPRSRAGLVVLSAAQEQASRRTCEQLGLAPRSSVLRMMTLLLLDDGPVALFDSSLPLRASAPLRRVLTGPVPQRLPRGLVLPVQLGRLQVSIETSWCSSWEAQQLHVAGGAAVFVTSALEVRTTRSGDRPLEVARGVYRSDRVQFRLEFSGNEPRAEARWQLGSS